MVADMKRSKTESLSLRLDPKTKFILDFVARLRGQSITTVVERFIKEQANSVKISRDDFSDGPNWSHFWDPSEGVRTLKLLGEPSWPTTFDEDELRQFTLSHWPFFYEDSNGGRPKRWAVDVLWPKREELLREWREKRETDYWAISETMKKLLSSAGLKPPDWPTKPKNKSDLDDDVPF